MLIYHPAIFGRFLPLILYVPVALQMLDVSISPCSERCLDVCWALFPSISVELGLPKTDLQVRIKNESAVPLGMQKAYTAKRQKRRSLPSRIAGPRAVRWQLLCKDSKAKTQATLWMGKDGKGLPKWYPKKIGIEWILRKLHNSPGTIPHHFWYPWKEFATCWLMKGLECGVCCRGTVCWKDLEWDQWRWVLMMVSSRESFPSVSVAQWFSISWALGRYSNSTSLEISFFRAQDTMLLNGIDALPSTLCVFILE